MKTLIIHPADSTTDFLIPVWKNNPDWKVIRSNTVSKSEIRKQIKEHDRIICLGHGNEEGLFGKNRHLIDSNMVQLLREKVCVFVWCNADVFFKKYSLKGFVTGMIISEPEEAMLCCVPFTYSDIKTANYKLTASLKIALQHDISLMHKNMVETYSPKTGVEWFNYNNFYLYDN